MTFSLFAAVDIPSKDGKVLPKDGLLETVTLTDVQEEDGRWVGKTNITLTFRPCGKSVSRAASC